MKTETFFDKSTWGDGPWSTEPDLMLWVDPQTKLNCLIQRQAEGFLRGFVGLPPDHPWYGVQYNLGDLPVGDILVHKGLTFSGYLRNGLGLYPLAETGKSEEPYWFGFDTCHFGDYSPLDNNPNEKSDYKDFSYVKGQVESLAQQLFAISTGRELHRKA